MREALCIHIGQAGVQIGNACWELFCLELGAASPTAYANVIYRAPHSVKRPLLALGDTARSSRPKRPRVAQTSAASMSGPSVAPPSAAAVPAAPAATTVTHA